MFISYLTKQFQYLISQQAYPWTTIIQFKNTLSPNRSCLIIIYSLITYNDQFNIILLMSARKQGQAQQITYSKVGRGEYELHVLVEATSGLSLVEDGSIDVKVGITAFGNTEYTKVKKKIGVEETFWGEHFYFTKIFENSEMAENERVIIAVYDYNRILANTLVGSYQIDVQRIYSERNHILEHTWLALSNMERSFAQITGYVKISASLLSEKDQNVELSVQPIASITKQRKVLVPPQIQRKTYQITIDVVQGKHIKPADGTTVDSYLGFQFGQTFAVSETILKNCFPKYNTRVHLALSLPAAMESIAVRLNDFNFIQKVQLLGSYYFNISQMLTQISDFSVAQKNSKNAVSVFQDRLPLNSLRWVNFYGPQKVTKKEDAKNVQQFFPTLAPYYVGSVLMQISMQENNQPIVGNQKMSQQAVNQYARDVQKFPPLFYQIEAHIIAALNLYDKNKKHKILIRIGAQETQTDFSQGKNGLCFWNVAKRFTIQTNGMQTLPDIFIYLVDEKNNNVCYLRYKPKQGIIQIDEWIRLIPDNALVNFKAEQAGYIQIGLSIASTTRKDPQQSRSMNSNLASLYANNRKTGRLVIDLLCADSLLPLDDDGSIDAFFTFHYMQSQVTSSVKNDTLNPIYYQRLIIETDILDQQSCPPIVVNAWDKDALSNEFLGSVFIDVGQAMKNKSLVYAFTADPQPFWYTIENNGLVAGKFLATFRVLPNYTQSIPKEINIPQRKYEMTLVVMGLRGLKHSGILSVKQPFIEFDFGGLRVSKGKGNKQAKGRPKFIKTEPNQKGRSININKVIPAKLTLPQNYQYWPSLSGRVKDNVLGEFYQPILGYFSINLQKSYLRSANMKEEFVKRQKSLLQVQNQIINKPEKMAEINDSLLMSLRNFVIKSLNYNWKVASADMANQLNSVVKYPNKKLNEDYIIVFPYYSRQKTKKQKNNNSANINQKHEKAKYVESYKDIIIANGQYIQVGYDDNAMRKGALNKRNKHYRFVLNQPYETYYQRVYGLKMGAMEETSIRIGRVFTNNDITSSLVRKVSKEDTEAGVYKGQLFITEFNRQQRNSAEEDEFRKATMSLLNMLTKKGKVHMFLYIIEAANLAQKDMFSNSDPYLVVKAGKQKQSFQKEYFDDEPNPQFFKKVHMILEFPTDSTVDIEVWDYDPITADELIGSVSLDIQDRIDSKLSDVRFNNPIETHSLYHETSKRPQGLIKFWIDLVPMQNISLYRQFDIARKVTSSFEVRIIVWSVEGMPNNDIQDMSDLYVKCDFNDDTQETDVHYRTSTGEGNFNWRMVYPLKLPLKNPMISFKVFDKDIITSDDYLASGSFSIQKYLEEAFETDCSMSLFLGNEDLSEGSDLPMAKCHMINGEPMYDMFKVDMINRLGVEQSNKTNVQGKLKISMEILTQEQAKRKPAGKGRDNPNQYPFLPAPKNRFQFTWNPIKLIGQLCGPQFKKQIAIALCLFLCLGSIVYLAVSFGGSVIGSIVGTKTVI